MNPTIHQLLEILTVCVSLPWLFLRTTKYAGRSTGLIIGDLLATSVVVGFSISTLIVIS